jgi:hypothetical protein
VLLFCWLSEDEYLSSLCFCPNTLSVSCWAQSIHIDKFYLSSRVTCRSQWQRGLRRRSLAASFAGSRVRIPLGAWMFVVFICCVVGRGLCDGLITRPEESYRVSVCVWSRKPEKGGKRSILDHKRLWMNEWIHVTFISCRMIRLLVNFCPILSVTCGWMC